MSECESEEFVVKNESEEDLSETDKTNKVKRKRAIRKDWRKKCLFMNAAEAEEFIDAEQVWKKTTRHSSTEGIKVKYRCKEGLYRKAECPAERYLLYHCDSTRVTLFETEDEHANHGDNGRGLSSAQKCIVRQLFSDGIKKPNAIIAEFRRRNEQSPVKSKLKTFLTSLRSDTHWTSSISADSLAQGGTGDELPVYLSLPKRSAESSTVSAPQNLFHSPAQSWNGDELPLYLPKRSAESSLTSAPQNLLHKEAVRSHDGFTCNSCSCDIIGYRYTCVQCFDYNQCGSCEARGAHCLHYVLRIPAPRPYAETQSMLNAIRSLLAYGKKKQPPPEPEPEPEQKPDTQEETCLDIIKVEIKEELPDPLQTEGDAFRDDDTEPSYNGAGLQSPPRAPPRRQNEQLGPEPEPEPHTREDTCIDRIKVEIKEELPDPLETEDDAFRADDTEPSCTGKNKEYSVATDTGKQSILMSRAAHNTLVIIENPVSGSSGAAHTAAAADRTKRRLAHASAEPPPPPPPPRRAHKRARVTIAHAQSADTLLIAVPSLPLASPAPAPAISPAASASASMLDNTTLYPLQNDSKLVKHQSMFQVVPHSKKKPQRHRAEPRRCTGKPSKSRSTTSDATNK